MGQDQGYFAGARGARRGVTAKDNRLFVEAVLIATALAFPGENLPNVLVTPSRFIRLRALAKSWRTEDKYFREMLAADADNNEDAMIGQHHRTRTSAQRRAAKKTAKTRRSGRSKGGLSTKIHAMVDAALGNPLAFFLTPGQAHDLQGADSVSARYAGRHLVSRQGFRCR